MRTVRGTQGNSLGQPHHRNPPSGRDHRARRRDHQRNAGVEMDAYALSKVQLFKERTIIVFVRLELTIRTIYFIPSDESLTQ